MLNKIRVVLLIMSLPHSTLLNAGESAGHFKEYRFPQDGFSASFPSKPLEYKTPLGKGRGYSYSYQALVVNPPSQFSVFVGHSTKRVFEDASINASLEGLVTGLLAGSDKSKLLHSKELVFKGFPAREYKYSAVVENRQVIVRGVGLIVDGDHYRLSYLYTPDNQDANANYEQFLKSFELTPLEPDLVKKRYNMSNGISILPPVGWELSSDSPKYEQILGVFSNLSGHALTLMAANYADYSCVTYGVEVKSSQEVHSSGNIELGVNEGMWIKSIVYDPSVGIRFTSKGYCIDTKDGVVVIQGMAPESLFFRSERIFDSVAKSIRIDN